MTYGSDCCKYHLILDRRRRAPFIQCQRQHDLIFYLILFFSNVSFFCLSFVLFCHFKSNVYYRPYFLNLFFILICTTVYFTVVVQMVSNCFIQNLFLYSSTHVKICLIFKYQSLVERHNKFSLLILQVVPNTADCLISCLLYTSRCV